MSIWIVRKKSTGEEKRVEAPTREAALASLIEHLFDIAEQTDLFGEPAGDALAISRPPLPDYVAAQWTQLAREFPNVCGIRALDQSRRVAIVTRAKAAVVPGQDQYGVWDEMFRRIRASLFLTGRCPPGKDRTKPFGLTIDYVLRAKEFSRILEGGYPSDDNGYHALQRSFDAETGRRYGPTEQAAAAWVDDRVHREPARNRRRGAIAIG